MLLKAAKSCSKAEDPEQVKLKAKAKEMQRAETEKLRQHEANMTALRAIGTRKKPKLDMSGSIGNENKVPVTRLAVPSRRIQTNGSIAAAVHSYTLSLILDFRPSHDVS